jgi:hypothetical protein
MRRRVGRQPGQRRQRQRDMCQGSNRDAKPLVSSAQEEFWYVMHAMIRSGTQLDATLGHPYTEYPLRWSYRCAEVECDSQFRCVGRGGGHG